MARNKKRTLLVARFNADSTHATSFGVNEMAQSLGTKLAWV
jgi:hypothetical protein